MKSTALTPYGGISMNRKISILVVSLLILLLTTYSAAAIEQQITYNEDIQTNPSIDGNRIVWDDSRNRYDDIYMYDIATGIETKITDPSDTSIQELPDISGNYIVWTDTRNRDRLNSFDF